MSEQSNEKRKRLRQKMINLMYLIFIVLAFIYIPTDFIDNVREIDHSLQTSDKQINKMRSMCWDIIQIPAKFDSAFTASNVAEYQRFLESADKAYKSIDLIKENLLKAASSGYTANGFLLKPTEFQKSETYFLDDANVAMGLRNILLDFHAEIKTLPSYVGDSVFKAYINIDSVIVNSSGKVKSWENFHFKKTPITVSVALMSKFRSDVAKIEAQTIQTFIERISEQYVLGVKAKKPIDEAELKKIDDMQKEVASFKTNSFPSIEKKEFESLYLGLKNPLRISHPRYKMSDMVAEITNGEIHAYKDSVFYATPVNPGPVEVRIYNRLGNVKGASLLISKKFIAREMPTPNAYLADRISGTISAKILSVQNSIELKNSDLRAAESFTVKQYSVLKVSKDGNIQQSPNNSGPSFNANTRQVLDAARSGDVLLFDNIKVVGPNGSVVNIPSLVLNVL